MKKSNWDTESIFTFSVIVVCIILVLFFLSGCCASLPNLPEHKAKVYTETDDDCLSETFTVSNKFIGFEGDIERAHKSNCDNLTGFSFDEWIDLETYLKAVFDTHNIPKDKVNFRNNAVR